jgi:thymidylate synthase (FAD)
VSVKLISFTQPAPELVRQGIRTAQDLIVYAARVSNPINQLNTASGPRLLRYCMEHGHWSVFEQASLGVEITTSRAISAQILRHRSFHFQEFSQRYASVPAFEPVELRRQAAKNRQSSSEHCDSPELKLIVNRQIELAEQAYSDLLDAGVARECARMILPMCAQTVVYMTGSVRDWIHYLRLRTKEDTQLEHRHIAFEISCIFRDIFPDIAEAMLGDKDE